MKGQYFYCVIAFTDYFPTVCWLCLYLTLAYNVISAIMGTFLGNRVSRFGTSLNQSLRLQGAYIKIDMCGNKQELFFKNYFCSFFLYSMLFCSGSQGAASTLCSIYLKRTEDDLQLRSCK